jgi:hypothetical protein
LGLEINPNDNQQRLYIYVRAYPVGRNTRKPQSQRQPETGTENEGGEGEEEIHLYLNYFQEFNHRQIQKRRSRFINCSRNQTDSRPLSHTN